MSDDCLIEVVVWAGLTVHVLPNISRSKGNQAMKLDLEKSYTKCDKETSPRPFSGKLKLSISLDQ